jgi:hypothetical protein
MQSLSEAELKAALKLSSSWSILHQDALLVNTCIKGGSMLTKAACCAFVLSAQQQQHFYYQSPARLFRPRPQHSCPPCLPPAGHQERRVWCQEGAHGRADGEAAGVQWRNRAGTKGGGLGCLAKR